AAGVHADRAAAWHRSGLVRHPVPDLHAAGPLAAAARALAHDHARRRTGRGDDGAHLQGRDALRDHEPAGAGSAPPGSGHSHLAAGPARWMMPMTQAASVAEVLARDLAAYGARRCFGLLGTANFKISHALVENGVELISARHEGNAASMADAYAKATGELTLVSVHSGPGLTNALTGIGEAAKSRTPLLL